MAAALKILAVDNEPSVTLSLRYIFSGPRYDLTTVDCGRAALVTLDAQPSPYHVIIVDQKMPDVSGLELVRAIRERKIKSKIVVISAFLTSAVREAYERMDVNLMFPKPFDIAQLRSTIEGLN
jgi:DNA-binding response OmpR family regulator